MMLTTSRASESVGEVVKAFPIFLMVSYVFGIVPSLLYAGIMELWFCNKLNEKLGCILTILFSVLLGFLSGFIVFVFSKPFTKGTASDMLHIAGIGALVGLVIGISSAAVPCDLIPKIRVAVTGAFGYSGRYIAQQPATNSRLWANFWHAGTGRGPENQSLKTEMLKCRNEGRGGFTAKDANQNRAFNRCTRVDGTKPEVLGQNLQNEQQGVSEHPVIV